MTKPLSFPCPCLSCTSSSGYACPLRVPRGSAGSSGARTARQKAYAGPSRAARPKWATPSGSSPAWSGLGRTMEVVIGLILLVISVSGLFAGGLGLFGWEWLGLRDAYDSLVREAVYEYPRIKAVIETPWVQWLAAAVCFLPFLGMLYGSIMMIFHFKSPSWHPGLGILTVV